MTLALLGINILIFIAVWNLMVKKTILDHSRDKLFDLRDDVRHEFLMRGWGLDAPVYKNLRTTLDTYLRHTDSEGFSVWRFFFIERALKRNPPLLAHMRAQVERQYSVRDKEQDEYVLSIRRRSAYAMLEFSVYSSGLLLLIAIAYTPIYMTQLVSDKIKHGLGATLSALAGSGVHMQRTVGTLWRASVRHVGNSFLAPDGFEAAFSSRAWGQGNLAAA